jgi:hypothetical protein
MTIVTGIYLEAKNASMRELLRRATIFAEDMTALSGGVEAAHQDLQAKVDSSAERTEVAASVTALSERVKELTSRLDKFRTVDRLETTHHRVSEGWIARARRFVDERLQGRA